MDAVLQTNYRDAWQEAAIRWQGLLERGNAGRVIVSSAVLGLIKHPALLLGLGSCPELALRTVSILLRPVVIMVIPGVVTLSACKASKPSLLKTGVQSTGTSTCTLSYGLASSCIAALTPKQ